MFNGDPAVTETVEVKDSKTGQMKSVQQPVAHGVHSAYEDGLVNFHTPEIIAGLKKTLTGHNGLALNQQSGFGAAVAVVKLMQQTFATIQPKDIVKAYVPIKKLKPKEIADHLWTQFGQDTIQVMADGARTLAMLWESAWAEGGGTARLANAGKNIKPSAFKSLYIQPSFLPSFTLAQIKPALSGKRAAKPARAARAKVKRAGA